MKYKVKSWKKIKKSIKKLDKKKVWHPFLSIECDIVQYCGRKFKFKSINSCGRIELEGVSGVLIHKDWVKKVKKKKNKKVNKITEKEKVDDKEGDVQETIEEVSS